ncbi:MAG: hypothetical protein M0P73_11925 [Syntrophobacterales bacterium]|jgi:hypothetical protein|nr:hypothetical protein [Syntrophobacterales bacterium]
MNNFYRKLSLIFTAGAVGGLLKAVVAWAFGAVGLNALLGFPMAPALTPMWIYQHMVWGGIWAFLFLLPFSGSYYVRGALYSLGQTLVQLLVIFPKMQKGMLGLELGYMAPILVTFFGVIWGLATGFWLKFSREG